MSLENEKSQSVQQVLAPQISPDKIPEQPKVDSIFKVVFDQLMSDPEFSKFVKDKDKFFKYLIENKSDKLSKFIDKGLSLQNFKDKISERIIEIPNKEDIGLLYIEPEGQENKINKDKNKARDILMAERKNYQNGLEKSVLQVIEGFKKNYSTDFKDFEARKQAKVEELQKKGVDADKAKKAADILVGGEIMEGVHASGRLQQADQSDYALLRVSYMNTCKELGITKVFQTDLARTAAGEKYIQTNKAVETVEVKDEQAKLFASEKGSVEGAKDNVDTRDAGEGKNWLTDQINKIINTGTLNITTPLMHSRFNNLVGDRNSGNLYNMNVGDISSKGVSASLSMFGRDFTDIKSSGDGTIEMTDLLNKGDDPINKGGTTISVGTIKLEAQSLGVNEISSKLQTLKYADIIEDIAKNEEFKKDSEKARAEFAKRFEQRVKDEVAKLSNSKDDNTDMNKIELSRRLNNNAIAARLIDMHTPKNEQYKYPPSSEARVLSVNEPDFYNYLDVVRNTLNYGTTVENMELMSILDRLHQNKQAINHKFLQKFISKQPGTDLDIIDLNKLRASLSGEQGKIKS